jgi:hypothetical protein
VAEPLRVALEVGPKGRKAVAVAVDWPGLERGASTREGALAALGAYLPRYAPVAVRARLGSRFRGHAGLTVVEEYQGTGSTDFWGISFAFSAFDSAPLSDAELRRELSLVSACWGHFDAVRARVSPAMRKGPRGGGRDRDRDQIVRHVLGVEQDWATKVGVRTPVGEVVLDDEGIAAFREAYRAAIRSFHAHGRAARTWPLRYLIRHTAFHTMDHAWEMEDKDLSRAFA